MVRKRTSAVIGAIGISCLMASFAYANATARIVKIKADPSHFYFDSGTAQKVKTVKTKAGALEIRMWNPSTARHSIAVRGPGTTGAAGKVVAKGKTSIVKITLKPGTYTLYCTVPSHEQAGMKATLVVS